MKLGNKKKSNSKLKKDTKVATFEYLKNKVSWEKKLQERVKLKRQDFNSEIYYYGYIDRNDERIILIVGESVEESEELVKDWSLDDFDEHDLPYTEMTLFYTDGLKDTLDQWAAANPEEAMEFAYYDFADTIPNTITELQEADDELVVDMLANLLFDLCSTEWDDLKLPFTVEEHEN